MSHLLAMKRSRLERPLSRGTWRPVADAACTLSR
jgi:hypothetical protein